MINYVPERIYKIIKDDPDYKSVVESISTKKQSCVSLKEWVLSDADSFYGDKAAEYRKTFENVINKLCPQYLLQYQVNNGDYTADKLLEFYNSKKYDAEYNFFFLSNIINQSYENGLYPKYLEILVADYEALDEVTRKSLSNYVHLKYMYAKIYILTVNLNIWYDKFAVDMFNNAYVIYQNAVKYTNDTDTANNYFLEAMSDSAQQLAMRGVSNDNLLTYIGYIIETAQSMKFQYENYSFAYAKLLDMKNMVYLYERRHTDFVSGMIILTRYLSTALDNKYKLYSGLNYYDKCNHGMFLILIRKYVKLKTTVPILRQLDDVAVKNITANDYAFAMADTIDVSAQSEYINVVINKYKDSVDNWFKDSNKAYSTLCSIGL